jgi:hypothetical protein
MKGKLLDQWADAFRQDTNVSLILYVIVFLDGTGTADMWDIEDVSIRFRPLTEAFNKLFFVSFFKTLFDTDYTGKPTFTPAVPGTAAAQTVRITNPTDEDRALGEGTSRQRFFFAQNARILT